MIRNVVGYDGMEYTVGDMVELHHNCDLWVKGAKFGRVTRIRSRQDKRQVQVELDNRKGKRFSGPSDKFRKVS